MKKKKICSKIIEHFEKKVSIFYFGGGLCSQPKSIQGLEFFLGLVHPSRNRLASTAYFAKPGFSVLHACNKHFFFKSDQILMEDAESAELKEKSNLRFFQFIFFELWSFLIRTFFMNF